MPRRRSACLLTAACLLAGLAGAAPAAAVQVADGTTAIALSATAMTRLDRSGVRVGAQAPARAAGATFELPVTGGLVVPGTTVLRHGGSLRFTRGARRAAAITRLRIDGARLRGRLGRRLLTIARIAGASVAPAPDQTGLSLTGARLTATTTAARALNRTLGARAFAGGADLGTASADAGRSLRATGGTTTLAFDPGTAGLLAAGGATLAPAGTAVFQITGGRLSARTLAGHLTHTGALALTPAGGAPYTLGDPALTGTVLSFRTPMLGRQDVADVDLRGAVVSRRLTEGVGVLTIENVPVVLQPVAAGALGQAAGVPLPGQAVLGLARVEVVVV
jgi:hypothetical protein